MATLKERLDAYEGQPEQQWTSRKNLSVGEKGQKNALPCLRLIRVQFMPWMVVSLTTRR